MTVTEMSKRTGVSVRTLHHYDSIGLLKPTSVTEAGYRLYDNRALEMLFEILVFRELGMSLKEIAAIIHASDYDRNRILENQIALMHKQIRQLQDRITLANGILTLGVNYMSFEDFNPSKMDDYSQQAKALYGKTDAYKEFAQKSAGRTAQQDAGQSRGNDLFGHPLLPGVVLRAGGLGLAAGSGVGVVAEAAAVAVIFTIIKIEFIHGRLLLSRKSLQHPRLKLRI